MSTRFIPVCVRVCPLDGDRISAYLRIELRGILRIARALALIRVLHGSRTFVRGVCIGWSGSGVQL